MIFKQKDFLNIYLNICSQSKIKSLFNSNIDINLFYSTIKKIDNIIQQNKNLIFDIPDNLLTNLISIDKFQSEIQNSFFYYLNQSKHKYNFKLKNNIKIYYFKFPFNDDIFIDMFHKFLFDYNQQNLIKARQKFKQINPNIVNGFTIYNPELNKNIIILVLNTNSSNYYNTLYHQLSHTIQYLTGIKKIKLINKRINNKILDKFNITFQYFQYYFSQLQFLPNIQDLIFELNNLYQKKYNNITKKQFILNILNSLFNENFQNTQIFKNFHSINLDSTSLIMLYCSFKLHFKFQKIKYQLLKYFK